MTQKVSCFKLEVDGQVEKDKTPTANVYLQRCPVVDAVIDIAGGGTNEVTLTGVLR